MLSPRRSCLTVGLICADIPYEFGEDPDEFYSSVACEHLHFFFSSIRNTGSPPALPPSDGRIPADDKGANFLYYLEKLVGGVEVFNPYQKAYIQAFEGKSLTTQQWEEHFWCVPPESMNITAALMRVLTGCVELRGSGRAGLTGVSSRRRSRSSVKRSTGM